MRRLALIVLGAVVIVVAAGLAYAWQPAIQAAEPPSPATFDAAVLKKGAVLAAIGNCNACHTAPNGKPFAGGLAMPTPLGTFYSTNITPDRETGIGAWSEAAFSRAMREGVDRAGRHLYPAFPYDHFTKLTDADISALYAFMMTRAPVRAEARANALRFPFNMRILVAGWKLLYFRRGPYQNDPAHDEAWNRGAYLVSGLAHCGACHTPRNRFGAEEKDRALSGGEIEGWTAYPLDKGSLSPIPWDRDALAFYLKNGWHAEHGIARGPMTPVVENLGTAPDADVRAIATYLADLMGPPDAGRTQAAEALRARLRERADKPNASDSLTTGHSGAMPADTGAAIYTAACATCHEAGRPMPFGGLDLSLSTGPQGPNAKNVLNVVLYGLPAAEGGRSPIMPAFGAVLSDEQLTALATYVRATFSQRPAWTSIKEDLRDSRTRAPAAVRPSPETGSAPPNPSTVEKQR